MEKEKEQRIKEAASKIISNNKGIKDIKEKVKKRALSSLAIKQETAKKVGAALMVGKALHDRELDVPINKDINLKVNANKGKERIGIFFKKEF